MVPGMLPMDEEERRRQEAMGLLPPEDAAGGGGAPAVPATPVPVAAPPPAAMGSPLVLAPPGDVSKTVVTAVKPSAQSQQALTDSEAAGRAVVDATRREAEATAIEKKTGLAADATAATAERDQARARADFEHREAERLKNIDVMAERDLLTAKEGVERAYQAQQRGYFADKPWYTGILAAVAVAASRRNMRIMGENPNNSGVQASIDKAIDADTKAKTSAYLKSQEYLEAVKKRPGEAREILAKKRIDFAAEQAAELNLIAKEAGKLKASAALDPAKVDAEAMKAAATAEEKRAESLLKNRQHYDATTARTDVDPAAAPAGHVPPAVLQKYNALKYQAGVADQGLQKIQGMVKDGVPKPGTQKWDEYQATLKSTAAAIALVESGNPESEASDPTKRAIIDRIGRGAVESVGIDLAAGAGLTEGTAQREASKLAAERGNLSNRLKTFEQSFGGAPAAAPAAPAKVEKPSAASPAKPYPDYSIADLQQAYDAAKKAGNARAMAKLSTALGARRKLGE